MPDNIKAKEKEREAQLKQLRQELEEKLSEQLPAELREEKHLKNEKFTEREITSPEEAKRVIEAILFTASKPMTVNEFKRILKGYNASQVEQIIRELQADYVNENHSFRINEVAGGFEISTESQYAPWILKLELQKKAKQATQSALETLAILAYKQPMTKAEIEDLRGVDVSGVISTLLERNLIKVVGRKEVPGRPFLYGTTDKFLEHFGLKSLEGLPNLEEIKMIVEKSVKKEELLGKTQIVEVPPEVGQNTPVENTTGQEENQVGPETA